MLMNARAQVPCTPTHDAGELRSPRGLLESFLKDTRAPDVVRKKLGALAGRNGDEVTFTAVIASNPLVQGQQARGIEVEVKDCNRKVVTFLDDDRRAQCHLDSLKDFEKALTRLAERERTEVSNPLIPAQVGSTTTGFFNRPASPPEACSPRLHVFNAGWYRDGETTGVRLDGAGTARISIRLPGVTLDQVVGIIQAGYEFLTPR
jgi:hypothetical protein